MTKKEFWTLYPGGRPPNYHLIVGVICWRYNRGYELYKYRYKGLTIIK